MLYKIDKAERQLIAFRDGGQVPARLSSGEFVFSAEAAGEIGLSNLEMLRRGVMPEGLVDTGSNFARLPQIAAGISKSEGKLFHLKHFPCYPRS